MITSERTQNVIVTLVIVVALVSSVLLVSNASYYGGSYILAETLDVDVTGTRVTGINHENESIFPRISFTVNFHTNTPLSGNVRIEFIRIVVQLNNAPLTYTTFTQIVADDYKYLHPNYDHDFILGKTTSDNGDRNTVLNADNTTTWNWYLEVSYYYVTFDIPESITWRFLNFNYTGLTT